MFNFIIGFIRGIAMMAPFWFMIYVGLSGKNGSA